MSKYNGEQQLNQSGKKSFILRHRIKLILTGCALVIIIVLAAVLGSVLNKKVNFTSCDLNTDALVFQKSFQFDGLDSSQFVLKNLDGKGSFKVQIKDSQEEKLKFDMKMYSKDLDLQNKMAINNQLEESKQIVEFKALPSFESCYIAVITILLPVKLDQIKSFEASIQSGSLDFDGGNKTVHYFNVDVVNGSQDIFNLNGVSLKLTSKHGSIKFNQLNYKEVQVESRDGSVLGKQFQAESLKANSDHGSLNFQINKVKDVEAYSDNGSVTIEVDQLVDNSKIRLNTNKGSGTLKFNKFNGAFQLKSNKGSVNVKTGKEVIYSEKTNSSVNGYTKENGDNSVIIEANDGSGRLEM